MITCEEFDALLLEGDEASMAAAARHAHDCDRCRQQLDDWNDISMTAKSLHATWQNDMLWPRIDRALRNETRSAQARFRQIAAAVVLTIGLGGGTWYAVHERAEQRAFDRAILRDQALRQVEEAERAHIAAINQLEKVASPKLDDPSSPILVSYKEKVMLLDDAIAECESVIQQNRNNAQLRKQLLAMYSAKQRTLEDVLREGPHATNQ
ncbi:MAG TPA: hypothetical protein VF381_07575 [Thermoanaerobaculia bacterium]